MSAKGVFRFCPIGQVLKAPLAREKRGRVKKAVALAVPVGGAGCQTQRDGGKARDSAPHGLKRAPDREGKAGPTPGRGGVGTSSSHSFDWSEALGRDSPVRLGSVVKEASSPSSNSHD